MTVVDQESLPCTVIEPRRRGPWLNLRELWAYRELLYFFAWRDVTVRYKQTALGALWAVIQPTFLMIVFTLVLGKATGAEQLTTPYSAFVFAGLLGWTLFATGLSGASNSLLESERLITKVYFPRLLMPLAAFGPALVDSAVSSLVLVALLAWHGRAPAGTIVFAPLGLAVILLAAVGAGSLLAALNVRYRDFRYTTTFLLQAWLFSTPAVYVAAFESPANPWSPGSPLARLTALFILANPLNGGIAFFRAAVLGMPLPWPLLAASAGTALVMTLVGVSYFRRVEDSFADVI